MKKANFSIGREGLVGKPKLPVAEMEHELDHCSAPWRCPEACYRACVGCSQKKEDIDEEREMKADLVRKYGNGEGECYVNYGSNSVHQVAREKSQMRDTFPRVHQRRGSVVAHSGFKDEAREEAGIHAHSITWRWFE